MGLKQNFSKEAVKSDLYEKTKESFSSIQEKALIFAMFAHKGQVRKAEINKPRVLHPIAVADIIRNYLTDNEQQDENLIAAGYLHDVIEDTKYTKEDIERNFGKDVADLVDIASEPDKTLSWKERKTHTIQSAKNRTLREKILITADKINNIEDIGKIFDRRRI